MTILVYANRELGCDSLVSRGYQNCGETQKIHIIWSNNSKMGLFVAIAGKVSETYKVLEYFRSFIDQEMPEKPHVDEDTRGILVDPINERAYWFDENLEPIEVSVDGVMTEGSGSEICVGALGAGATVMKALEVTAENSNVCGGTLYVYTMKEMRDMIKEKLKSKEICCLMRYRLLRAKGVK